MTDKNTTKEIRPWGWFETIDSGPLHKVKKLFIREGSRISLQSHEKRSEHWVISKGLGEVELDGKTILVREGDYIFVPLKSIHRITAFEDVEIIEVQFGTCDEEDIKRYEDDYGRAVK